MGHLTAPTTTPDGPRLAPLPYRDREVRQALHVFVAGADQVTVTDVAVSATVNVDPVTVHADDGEHATVIAGRCPDFNCGRLNAS